MPSFQLQETLGGRHRQARRGLRRMPVRVRHLGGAGDLVGVLRRGEAAARCRLKGRKIMEQPKVGEEMRKMPVEPLLSVEKKLIGWSLGIGLVLLVILIFATRGPIAG